MKEFENVMFNKGVGFLGVIYCIENKINGKKYVGQTIRDLEDRINAHFYNSNKRDLNMAITKAIKKYGIDNFKWYILEDGIPKELLNEKEVYYIKDYDTYFNGYNLTIGGRYTSRVTYKFDDFKNKVDDYRQGILSINNDFDRELVTIMQNFIESTSLKGNEGMRYWKFIEAHTEEVNVRLDSEEIKKYLNVVELLNNTCLTYNEIEKISSVPKSTILGIKDGKIFKFIWKGKNNVRFISEFNDKRIEELKLSYAETIFKDNNLNLTIKEIAYLCDLSIDKVRRLSIKLDRGLSSHNKGGKYKHSLEEYTNVYNSLKYTNKSIKEISNDTGIPYALVHSISSGKNKLFNYEKLREVDDKLTPKINLLRFLLDGDCFYSLSFLEKKFGMKKESLRNILFLKRCRDIWFSLDYYFFDNIIIDKKIEGRELFVRLIDKNKVKYCNFIQ